jgi:hypothetical protein
MFWIVSVRDLPMATSKCCMGAGDYTVIDASQIIGARGINVAMNGNADAECGGEQ